MKVSVGKVVAVIALAAVMTAAVPAAGLCGEDREGREIVEHTVLKGDNLMLLAGYYYKDPRQWREIYADNSGVLEDPNFLLPGTVLKVRDRSSVTWDISYEEFARLAGN